MHGITRRQQLVLDYIYSYSREQGMPPTRAEICQALGFRSPNAAEDHLKALAKKGVIELLPNTSRGIRLPEAANEEGLPLVGQVAAGSPILAIENLENRVQLDPALFSPRADYLLRVRGDSMIGAGIEDGDLLAVARTREARDGQILVVRVNDEVTVKRWHWIDRNHAELIAENPAYQPIPVQLASGEVAIEGRMVGIIRQH